VLGVMAVVTSVGWMEYSSRNIVGCDSARCYEGWSTTASHSLTVESQELVTIRAPSAENVTERIASLCSRNSPRGCLVAASHNQTVLSQEPITMLVQSGEKETN